MPLTDDIPRSSAPSRDVTLGLLYLILAASRVRSKTPGGGRVGKGIRALTVSWIADSRDGSYRGDTRVKREIINGCNSSTRGQRAVKRHSGGSLVRSRYFVGINGEGSGANV